MIQTNGSRYGYFIVLTCLVFVMSSLVWRNRISTGHCRGCNDRYIIRHHETEHGASRQRCEHLKRVLTAQCRVNTEIRLPHRARQLILKPSLFKVSSPSAALSTSAKVASFISPLSAPQLVGIRRRESDK
ncbi:hypothetical protein BDW72DRAFT_175081 [Aspergillus terricola var. indicus]